LIYISNIRNVSLTYLRGLDLAEVKEEDVPMVLLFKINVYLYLTNLFKYEKFISINGCNTSYSLSANR
jgi:hypothetical protein